MSDELEEQLDKMFTDFRIKVLKLVSKNRTKILKDQAKSFKDELRFASSPNRKIVTQQTTVSRPSQRKVTKYDDSSDDDNNVKSSSTRKVIAQPIALKPQRKSVKQDDTSDDDDSSD
jgi:hypothetical protein